MRLFPTLLSFALIANQAAASPPGGCALRMSENGNLVTLQGVVDPQDWPRGSYDMTIEARQGGNGSLSRQAGAFGEGAATEEGLLVLSTTTTYLKEGGRLVVTLRITDGSRNAHCSLEFER